MSLVSHVSYTEMMRMREEEGMTNKEIADSLDVHYQTVLKIIGRQPQGFRRTSGSRVAAPDTVYRSAAPVEEPPACLFVEDRAISLAGMFGSYQIAIKEERVTVNVNDTLISVPFDLFGEFINELSAIQRKLDGLKISNEMW